MIVYIPYGLLCIAVTILIFVAMQKARDNKKTNRKIRNSERFKNIISVIKDEKKDTETNSEEAKN